MSACHLEFCWWLFSFPMAWCWNIAKSYHAAFPELVTSVSLQHLSCLCYLVPMMPPLYYANKNLKDFPMAPSCLEQENYSGLCKGRSKIYIHQYTDPYTDGLGSREGWVPWGATVPFRSWEDVLKGTATEQVLPPELRHQNSSQGRFGRQIRDRGINMRKQIGSSGDLICLFVRMP